MTMEFIPSDPDIKRIILLTLENWMAMKEYQRDTFTRAVMFYMSPPVAIYSDDPAR